MGTIGLADALIVAGLRYGSDEAMAFTSRVFKLLNEATYGASIKLGEERGSFPLFDAEQYGRGSFIQELPADLQLDIQQKGIRNAFLTSQAPTGTIAKLAGVSEGIEPYFDRTTILKNRLGTHTVDAPDSPYLVTANEVTPEQHIGMMAAAQVHVDSAVSKTVNAPEDQPVEETDKVYRLAYGMGLKSVAYYRDMSRGVQVAYHGATTCETVGGKCD